MNFLKIYKNLFKFFRESKGYILFATALFFLFFIVGFVSPIFFRERIAEFILGLKDIFADKNLTETILLIFLNNLKASFFAIIFGIGFGIIPFAIAVMNGYILGFISREAVNLEGIGILWRLLPHGIFELPAVLISVGIGLKLGITLIKQKNNLKKETKNALKFFLFVVVPLLFVAAIIESLLIFYIK